VRKKRPGVFDERSSSRGCLSGWNKIKFKDTDTEATHTTKKRKKRDNDGCAVVVRAIDTDWGGEGERMKKVLWKEAHAGGSYAWGGIKV